MKLPTGRKLEQPDHDPDYQGSVRVLRRPDESSLRLARRNLREIAEHDIEGEGRYLLDKTTGETLEVVTSHVDLLNPKATGTTAFAIRDGWFVPLRPLGWTHKDDKSELQGEVYGREATGRDPMPLPSWLEIR